MQDTCLDLATLNKSQSHDRNLCHLGSHLELTSKETRGKNGDESKFQDVSVELVDRPCDHVKSGLATKL